MSRDQNKVSKGKVGKYLTEIKELPPEEDVEAKLQLRPTNLEDALVASVRAKSEQTALEKKRSTSEQKISSVENIEIEEENFGKLPFSIKDIILGIVNLASVVLIIIILVKLPSKAKELNKLRLESIESKQNIDLELAEVSSQKEKAQKLESLFLDDSGVVNFVNDVEKIKAEGGSITGVNFANPVAVKDRSGNFGIPIVIELVGTWEQISADIQKIDILPYLFRPVRIQVEPSKDKEGVIVYKYGVFLYVRNFGENR